MTKGLKGSAERFNCSYTIGYLYCTNFLTDNVPMFKKTCFISCFILKSDIAEHASM